MTDTGNFVRSIELPPLTPFLESFGLKFTAGGAHISRTMMLDELRALLESVAIDASAAEYRDAILVRNVLGKSTDSTRQKSLRHLRELFGLDPRVPIFSTLRRLHSRDSESLPQLALLGAWARDPLLRATTQPILEALPGDRVETVRLAEALELTFPGQYSELNRNKIARNAASSWTQSGHLSGHTNKVRRKLVPTVVALTMATFLGHVGGFHGAAVFSNPWCALLDLDATRARALTIEAHRAGLLDLRAVGEVVELSFPLFSEFVEAEP